MSKPIPVRVITKPTTSAGRELCKLYDAADRATADVAGRQKAFRDALDVKAAAEAAVAGAHRTAGNSTSDIALMRALEDARLAASPELHEPRVRAADRDQERAVDAVEAFIAQNVADLLEEIRPEAEAVAAELAEARARLAPIEDRYSQVASRVRTLCHAVHQGRSAPKQWFGNVEIEQAVDVHSREAWQLPDDRSEAPLPDPAVVEAVDREHHPDRYPEPVAVAT